jgi:hypothetical protein
MLDLKRRRRMLTRDVMRQAAFAVGLAAAGALAGGLAVWGFPGTH